MEYESVRRTPRYSLILDIELVDLNSGVRVRAKTKMLGLFGCGVDSPKLLPQGAKVQVKLTQEGTEFKALARVVYSSPALGMGIVFTSVEQGHQCTLEFWIAEYMSIPN